jgi:hypothetical protein
MRLGDFVTSVFELGGRPDEVALAEMEPLDHQQGHLVQFFIALFPSIKKEPDATLDHNARDRPLPPAKVLADVLNRLRACRPSREQPRGLGDVCRLCYA